MTDRAEIYVVDDNWLFALRVFRFVTQSFEIGEGTGEAARFDGGLESPDGLMTFYWIRPTAKLDKSFKPGDRAWALVDVSLGEPGAHDRWRRSLVGAGLRESSIWSVSSYRSRSDTSQLAIRPKNHTTLWALRNELLPPAKTPARTRGQEGIHVLITGAGFELRDANVQSQIGLPPTRRILLDMELDRRGRRGGPSSGIAEPKQWRANAKAALNADGFPTPVRYYLRELVTEVRRVAIARKLDEYWNLVLFAAHQVNAENATRALATLDPEKLEGTHLELRWREAFRRSICKYDIGHLEQHRIAADLPFDAWLSTNYTRFLDRAVDSSVSRGSWKILQTPIEALIFHRAVFSRPYTAAERIAIKLHGDIGQVYTMAVAGHDKEPYSPLSVQPDLHVMYVAATEALCERVNGATICTWHVVGHGLQDVPLLTLIKRVVDRTRDTKHRFIVVSPSPDSAIEELKKVRRVKVSAAVAQKALPYLTELRGVGLGFAKTNDSRRMRRNPTRSAT